MRKGKHFPCRHGECLCVCGRRADSAEAKIPKGSVDGLRKLSALDAIDTDGVIELCELLKIRGFLGALITKGSR